MKKILIILLSISGILNAQTLLDPSIANAISSSCCTASASGVIYVDSVSSNSVGDSLIVYKNGTRYAYKYPSGGGSAYTLPVATTSILGGVKDGSGVYIAPDGTISAEKQTFAQNGSNFIVTTYDTAGGVTPKTFTWTAPDFWRSSVSIPVIANTMPDGTNDTIEFIQHRQDIFIGGADGLVRAGQGSGNIATNTVFGKNALRSNTTGNRNTAVGENALSNNTTGFVATAVGNGAAQSNTTGYYTTAFGWYALNANTTGLNNTAMGAGALQSNTTAGGNTAMGTLSLNANTGSHNTGVGNETLKSNTTGSANTAIGRAALFVQTTAIGNTAIGYLAGQKITTGGFNTIIGSGDGANGGTANGLTTGVENIAIGSTGTTVPGFNGAPLWGVASANASRNILIGNSTANNLANNENIAIGFGSADIGNGTKNVILGSYSFGPNTGSGWATPANIATNNNTFIGSDYNKSNLAQVAIGNNNTSLGFNINQRIVGITNATAIGALSENSKSNQVQIGNTAIEDVRTFGYYTFQKQWDSSAVANQSLFVNSADGKLSFKDSSGNVFPLY